LVNLSSVNIPHEVQCLLQLGDNFSMPSYNKEKMVIDLIKSVESNTLKFDVDTQSSIRNRAISILNSFSLLTPEKNSTNQRVRELFRTCKMFIKNNSNIIVTRADKGNTTVMLDRSEYIRSIKEMLQDTNTYIKIKKDPTRKMIGDLRGLLTRWRNAEYISVSKYRSLYCSDGILPRAYGLPKIHKQGRAYRLIVSSIDSPFYALSSFLQRLLTENIPRTSSHVENSFQLIEKLRNIHIEDNYTLISLDVISLFTNIPLELALDSVSRRWGYVSTNCSVPYNEFLNGLKLILEFTYFWFDNEIFKQKFGAPMGSPLSPIIADLVMLDLEEKSLATLGCMVPFYSRYVDDIAMAVPPDKVNEVLMTFNGFHTRLQFTLEVGGDMLNFLDVSIIKNKNSIIYN